ncbi:putative guanidinium efflux system subunit GdnC [Paenibacillus allorhizosphaerae]|uniref:Guanidinium efflux system subunit GdnC n=2 Tax=Paenibacillus allorhizosphaerae TaxID=2849866 RepID=A0ABM8VLG7_9BACL|nr:putative guanidinium efflux system subunit GdnC [Paenibacillus allorhizosphaerae]
MLAGVFEVVWVAGLSHATAWWHWFITLAVIIFSFKVLLDAAAKLPIGTVYAVFTGLGTGGTVIAEMVFFGEPADPLKLLFVATLVAGVIGLKNVTREIEAKRGE